MSKRRTLYVSDMDGTLLNPESLVSDTTASILNKVIAEGALFTVATARTPATVSGLLENVRMTLPAAVMTGSSLWNPHTHIYSDTRFIAPEEVKKALGIYKTHHLPTFLYTLEDNILHIYHYGPLNHNELLFLQARLNTPFKISHVSPENPNLLPDSFHNVILLFAIQPTTEAEPVYRQLSKEVRCTLNYYHENFGPDTALLEMFAEGSSKARAIEDLVRDTEAERVVVFGDNVNDLPMMRIADVAVAVGNAVEEVKRRADIIIGTNASDSVAKWILNDYLDNQR